MAKEVAKLPVTRYDLSCPDEELKEILNTIVCCTDCGFAFDIDEENNDLVIQNKGEVYKVNISKYLDDTKVTDFDIIDRTLILKQSDDSKFEIPLQDIINQSIYIGTHTVSSSGLQVDIIIPHNLGFTPMFFSVQNETQDSEGYSFIKTTATNFIACYEVAPKVGINNLKYNWIVRR